MRARRALARAAPGRGRGARGAGARGAGRGRARRLREAPRRASDRRKRPAERALVGLSFVLNVDPAKSDRSGIESRVRAIASSQFGVATRKQLILAGLGPAAIDYRVRKGGLRVVHAGVYAIGYERQDWISRAMAAVLACGRGAVLSHGSAAAVLEIRPYPRGPIEVSGPRARIRPGIRHRRRRLPAQMTTLFNGLPVTTVPRTLLDLATVLDERALTRALNEARLRHGTRAAEIERLLAGTMKGQPGAARLARIAVGAQAPTRSVFEDAFLAFLARNQLPAPEVNRRIAGHEVDIVWRERRLVVELDGWRSHDTLDRFERDRARDADVVEAGYRVVRITWKRLTERPADEARRLRALLTAA